MFNVTVEDSFDAAHFLANYKGKCHNLHGHRWRVIVTFVAEDVKYEGNERGMAEDFAVLKDWVHSFTEDLDHSFIYEDGTLSTTLETEMNTVMKWKLRPVGFRPTAEEFARYFYNSIDDLLWQSEQLQNSPENVRVYKVTVYETPNNCAEYVRR